MTMHAPQWLRDYVLAIEGNTGAERMAERLGPLAERLNRRSLGGVLRGDWLGHALHPLMTDLPLGCFLGSGLLDVLGGRRARPASQRLIGMGLAFVPATAASGLADWSGADDDRVRRVGAAHATLNVAMTGAYTASWLLRRRGHHALGVGAGMLGGGLGWVSGYLGGHLSFNLAHGTGDRGLRGLAIPAAPS